jgi:hypothetical protein
MDFWPRTFDDILKLLTICGIAVGFFWGVYQWRVSRENSILQARFESKKPFLAKQLELYGEATKVAASLANPKDPQEREGLTRRFWQLYWGELGLVENGEVEVAMVAFGNALRSDATPEVLQRKSFELAKAIRRSLDISWGTDAWTKM